MHKRFADGQVRELLKKYVEGEIEVEYILKVLGIKRRRFFKLLMEYRDNPDSFSIAYRRKKQTRRIKKEVEKNILKELRVEKKLIENKEIPVKRYNYSYIRDLLWQKHQQKVALSTIISRAKEQNFYLEKPERKAHEREVLTNYPGELIQHDSSYHLWSPYADEKWYLITSLDDYSRKILYAELIEKELSWEHIVAFEHVCTGYGFPMKYYVDSHRIFRFVQGRDSFWRNHYKVTDEADPQWKQVLEDCSVDIIYALSPQAKGKIERPYGWLQDRIVRTCARENIRKIAQCRKVLKWEIDRYNNYQVHTTTGEIPSVRFNRALDEHRSLFRNFVIPPPYLSTKDIFCLRANRIVNSYRKISLNNLEIKLHGVRIGDTIDLRIVPNKNTGLAEVRLWCDKKFLEAVTIKNDDLNLVHF